MGFIGDVTKGLSDVAGMATPLGTIAGGISAVKGLFDNPSGDAMALAEKQHQWDVEENQRNRDFQREEWQRQFDAINAYNDPSATAERLRKAGLNASAILNGQGSAIGQSSGSPSAPSGAHGLNPMPDVVSQVGFQSQESIFKRLEMLGNLSKSAALLPETKAKLSAEVDNVLNDSRFKSIKADSEEFMLSLDKYFKPYERYAGVGQALANIALADAETKLAIAEGKQADENALKIAEEKLLTIAKRHLSEKELEALKIDLKYRDMQNQMQINESKSRQAANYASAEESKQSAEEHKQRAADVAFWNNMQNRPDVKHELIREAKERGKAAVNANVISEKQAKELSYIVEKLCYETDMQAVTYWIDAACKIVNSAGSAASQFYGAGALRELIKLRKAGSQSSVPLESGRGYRLDDDGLLWKRP